MNKSFIAAEVSVPVSVSVGIEKVVSVSSQLPVGEREHRTEDTGVTEVSPNRSRPRSRSFTLSFSALIVACQNRVCDLCGLCAMLSFRFVIEEAKRGIFTYHADTPQRRPADPLPHTPAGAIRSSDLR